MEQLIQDEHEGDGKAGTGPEWRRWNSLQRNFAEKMAHGHRARREDGIAALERIEEGTSYTGPVFRWNS
jgi:hypothetical protein